MNLFSKNLSQLRRIALSVLLASFAIFDTTSISAQELGRTITSPFGIARQPSASESGSEGDTFVDPETGEVGHIIRNPFGVANPEGVDTGIDIPDNGEEVGGVITNPFGTPNPNGVDTGVDVLDENEEYLISLPDDEESDVEESEDADEVDDETSDEVKVFEEESAETTTEKYVPVIDNPIRGVEFESFSFTLTGASGNISIDSEVDNISDAPMLYVATGSNLDLVLTGTTTMQSDRATISIVNATNNFPSNEFVLHEVSFGNNDHTIVFNHNVGSSLYNGSYNVTVSYRHHDVTVTRCLKLKIVYIGLYMATSIIGVNNLDIDADGIPDYADGFDSLWGGVSENNKSHPFTQLKLSISKTLNPEEYDVIFCFYEASCDIVRYFTGNGTIPYYYICDSADDGSLIRIWTKDGPVARQKESVYTDYSNVSGDYVPPGIAIPLQSLFKSGEYIESSHFYERMLYIEGICADIAKDGTVISCYLRRKQTSNNIASSSLDATVVKVNIVDPVRADNSNQQTGNTGEQNHYEAIKILIETDSAAEALLRAHDPDPDHYKTYYTSAQKKDHQVNITAHITPEMNNVPVYFEVIDPDDLSPYEGKTYAPQTNLTVGNEDLFANDNLDVDDVNNKKSMKAPSNYAIFQNACLREVGDEDRFTRYATTNDSGEATIRLDITNKCSGDNYIVRASCVNPDIAPNELRPFDKYSTEPPPTLPSSPSNGNEINNILDSLQYEDETTIAQTALLVAWKRTYIEHANMYQYGATVTQHEFMGSKMLHVDNTDDFNSGDRIEFFLPNDGTVPTSNTDFHIASINNTNNFIMLDNPLPCNIPKYSGVKKLGYTDTYSNDTSFLVKAFGGDAGGVDGGAFIEFKEIEVHNVPKYKIFRAPSVLDGYGNSWFINNRSANVMLLVAAKLIDFPDRPNIMGGTKSKITFIFFDKHTGETQDEIDNSIRNSTTHEIGHIWKIERNEDDPKFIHVDNKSASVVHENHANSDECVMNYISNDKDTNVEFCLDCLEKLCKQGCFYIAPTTDIQP